MKNRATTLLSVFAIAFFLGSCKAYRNLENITPKVSKEIQAGPFDKSELKKLIPGDRITVNTTAGFRYYMIYQNYTGDKLVGSIWKVDKTKLETSEKFEIPINEIETLYVRRVSAAATVPVVLVSLFVAVAGGFLLVLTLGGGIDLGF